MTTHRHQFASGSEADFNTLNPLTMIRVLLSACTLLAAVSAIGATIAGRVFLDRNGDGILAADEPGLARVVVSDGRDVVLTSASGEYSLAAGGGPFVFVSLPKGYRARDRFYEKADAGGPIHFGLIEWPESAGDALRFVQVSDTHVTEQEDKVLTFAEDAREINALAPGAAFVVATGDLVNRGERTVEFDGYLAGSADFAIPLFNLPGNHDANSGQSLGHYHRYFGPDYYSFNAGNCHFLLLNYMRLKEGVQQEWIKKDLAAAPKGATLIFAFHHLPNPDQVKWLADLGAAAVLSGHWHGNRVENHLGVFDLNTPPLRFGGIDRHPRGFRVLDVQDGRVANELRLGGFKKHAVIVSPRGLSTAAAGKIPVVVNAYHSSGEIASVECSIGGTTMALAQQSSWTWTGLLDAPARGGEHALVATIRAVDGTVWKEPSTFRLLASSGHSTDGSFFRLQWAASTGGFAGFSSPQAGRDGVVIGVDDKGDLRNCGVSAFDRRGKKRWHFATDSGIKNDVAVADGRVFATSVAGWLYALDESTGTLRWKSELDRARTRWEIAATIVEGGVVFAGSPSYMAAFEAKSGRKIWDARHGVQGDWAPESYPRPVVVQGKFIVNEHKDGAFALDAGTGRLAWQAEKFNARFGVSDGLIYTVTKDNALTAMAVADGKVRWAGRETIGRSSGSQPAIAGDRVVLGTFDGRIAAFSTKDGALRWSFQTGPSLTSLQPYQRGGSDVAGSPAILGDMVFVGAGDGVLYALSLATGEKLGAHRLGVPIASTPLIHDGSLYVSGYDGNVYAFSFHPQPNRTTRR